MSGRAGAHPLEHARSELAAQMERFPVAVRLLRRSLFRRYLTLNVRSCTPLLGVVGAVDGIDLDAAAWRISPPEGWPERPLVDDARRAAQAGARPFRFTPSQIARRHRTAGTVVRWSRSADHVVGVRVVGSSLELTAVDAGLRMDTRAGSGRLLVELQLPETIATAGVGRAVGDLFAHRWLAGGDWPVTSIRELPDGCTEVMFETGSEEWHPPWTGLPESTFVGLQL